MNGFPAVNSDPLSAAPPPPPTTSRRDIANRTAHYADEFHVYHKAKTNGNGTSKRASCNHCNGDWAYNETRLKNHIIDPYRGCRKIPQHIRDRIRIAHARAAQGNAAAAAAMAHNNPGAAPPPQPVQSVQPSGVPGVTTTTTPSGVQVIVGPGPGTTSVQAQAQAHAQAQAQLAGDMVVPPAKRKREVVLDSALLPSAQAMDQGAAGLRVGVEFSLNKPSGGLLRAQWIASELVQEFHTQLVFVTLQPSADDDVFNIWINGKVVWSRGPGTPLPDFEHIRPIVRAHASHT